MQKVIGINLNGNAYQLDESAFEILREYLARAERQLEDNPDRTEIMSDIEQAIADRCQACLAPHKTVVTAEEVSRIVAEMGPVDTPAGDGVHSGPSRADSASGTPPRRLYRILDGAIVGGVCNGLAAYFQIDVTLIRIVFAFAAVFTQGVGILAYIVLMFVIPEAKTPEARAAATGPPLNARDVVERAKAGYAQGSRQWRRQWLKQQRYWRRQGWPGGAPIPFGPPAWAAVVLPLFGLIHVALFLILASMLISLVNTGAILAWQLPPDVPMWGAVLTLLIAYQIAVSPFRAAYHWAWSPQPGVQPAWLAFWNAVIWLIGLAFAVWIASNHLPEIREFLQHLPDLVRDFAQAMRNLVER
jgi:phage shock protein PspC (stress-responsive transcriptional regulator)